MKKIKLFLVLLTVFTFTGCLKDDSFEEIEIYTTVYPIEYITNYLYGEHSTIYSIYPDGVDVSEYELSDKQVKNYGSSDLYIFNGLDDNQENVLDLVNSNSNLKIIDATNTMEYDYSMLELWIDPSNFLMMSKNIKNGLQDYIEAKYLDEEIEDKYDELKIEVSTIDAELKLLSESTSVNIIVTDSDTLLFLEKYGFEVISLDEGSTTDKMISNAVTFLKNANYKYIYVLDEENLSDTVNSVIEKTGAKVLEYNTMENITTDERNDKVDYITLLKENLDLLKESLYN